MQDATDVNIDLLVTHVEVYEGITKSSQMRYFSTAPDLQVTEFFGPYDRTAGKIAHDDSFEADISNGNIVPVPEIFMLRPGESVMQDRNGNVYATSGGKDRQIMRVGPEPQRGLF